MLELQMKHLKGTSVRHTRSSELTTQAPSNLLPLAALMLAGSMSAVQPALAQSEEKTLKTVTVKDTQDPNLSKESLLVKQTGIAKGNQQLKDIPQTVTVMTEKLMADRNYDDFREVLKSTAGVTFQAGETGEEDIRLRGFSLGQAGDIYVDGLRDVPMTERDTFNTDRVEVLKGSASMLFGKGSTGGVVNQVNKQPFLMDQNETNVTIGSGQMRRVTADLNKQTGDSSAFRVNAMVHEADNWGAKVDKKGIAPTYRWGIGERDEFSLGLYHLETDGRPLYSHPWLINTGSNIYVPARGSGITGEIVPVLSAKNYYGMTSDYLRTTTTNGTLTHTHRLDNNGQIKTVFRHGHYERDLLASATSFAAGTTINNYKTSDISRTLKGRRSESDITQVQSDYTDILNWFGKKHEIVAGIDLYNENALRNNSSATGLVKQDTNAATPNDGDVATGTRSASAISMASFKAQSVGLYLQDTISLTEQFKVLTGLRMDHFKGDYLNLSQQPFNMSETLFSPRVGAIWQPTTSSSYYTSFGESYNTSADTYQWTPSAASGALTGNNLKWLNTPPEKSRNFEVGSKFDVFDNKALLGIAIFHTQKFNERNLDEPTADSYLLSGKRHATGMEFNFAGRLTPAWEMFYNHTWIPDAAIDEGTARDSKATGSRPGLTPKHSASMWSTYKLSTLWRIGGGLNYRSKQTTLINENTAQAFTTVDVMVERSIGDSNTVKLNITNLTNKLYADGLYSSFYTPGAPRRVEMSWKSMF
jgi:catecholate siderophore receptor